MSLQPISWPQALIVPSLGLATALAVELPACSRMLTVMRWANIRYSAVPFLEATSQGQCAGQGGRLVVVSVRPNWTAALERSISVTVCPTSRRPRSRSAWIFLPLGSPSSIAGAKGCESSEFLCVFWIPCEIVRRVCVSPRKWGSRHALLVNSNRRLAQTKRYETRQNFTSLHEPERRPKLRLINEPSICAMVAVSWQ